MTVTLVPRAGLEGFRLSSLQVRLVAGALLAAGAPDRDLLAPHAYVPSQVCGAWAVALFGAVPELELVEVWDPQRRELRPRAVLRVPPGAAGPDPSASLPELHERTPVTETPLGPLLLALAGWLAACDGATVTPARV